MTGRCHFDSRRATSVPHHDHGLAAHALTFSLFSPAGHNSGEHGEAEGPEPVLDRRGDPGHRREPAAQQEGQGQGRAARDHARHQEAGAGLRAAGAGWGGSLFHDSAFGPIVLASILL